MLHPVYEPESKMRHNSISSAHMLKMTAEQTYSIFSSTVLRICTASHPIPRVGY